jgi:hypothetical protein
MKPRLSKIIWTDWPALFCAFAIPGIWIIGFVFPYLRHGAQFDTTAALTVALPISVIAGGFLLWRIGRIQRLFALGRLVPGLVLDVRIIRDRGRLDFTYKLDGNRFRSWMPIHKNKQTLALPPNQEVEVLVDASRPSRAVVRHLYE